MHYDPNKRNRLVIIAGVIGVLIIGSIIVALLLRDPSNQFGKFIRIQNFTEKVGKAPDAVRDASESGLYNTVEMNKNGGTFNTAKIKDAYIREGSDTKTNSTETGVTNGSYIVDMQSIKQSYRIQYSFSPTETNKDIGGSPVIITCLPESELIYGAFPCTDLAKQQSSKNDMILQYLPYQNFTFRISPDATKNKDKLTLVVELTIPEVDLKGDAETNKQTVQAYKNEVLQWIQSKDVSPDDYIIEYNYDENGNRVPDSIDYTH